MTGYQLNDLRQRAQARMFAESTLDADQVIELGKEHVFQTAGAARRVGGRGAIRTTH